MDGPSNFGGYKFLKRGHQIRECGLLGQVVRSCPRREVRFVEDPCQVTNPNFPRIAGLPSRRIVQIGQSHPARNTETDEDAAQVSKKVRSLEAGVREIRTYFVFCINQRFAARCPAARFPKCFGPALPSNYSSRAGCNGSASTSNCAQ